MFNATLIKISQTFFKEIEKINPKNIWKHNTPRIGGGGLKESSGGDEFKYDIFDTL
jgi:hypothetical protein